MSISNSDIKLYFNWSSNALIGTNPTVSDRYLCENYKAIKSVADYLLHKVNYQPREIYRGIIMKQDNLTELVPHKNMTYLSFSEDLAIAQSFGDPAGFGAQYGINHLLGNCGYIVSYTPQLSEILFHHSFIEIFPYIKVWNAMGIDGTEKTLEIQKEVMIRQPQEPFKNIIKTEQHEKILCCQGSAA